MFTGLIQDIGIVTAIDKTGDWRISVRAVDLDLSDIAIGASIAHNGVCLTIVENAEDVFVVQASEETLSKTNILFWAEGTRINLERALKLGDELGGHIVSGHVDGLAELLSIEPESDSYRMKFKVPEDLKGFIATKGSVALDGISLTVNEVENNVFGVNIIPHTWEKTNLSGRSVGDMLNIEIDMLARYVARMREVRL